MDGVKSHPNPQGTIALWDVFIGIIRVGVVELVAKSAMDVLAYA
jgi:hypothetical protein